MWRSCRVPTPPSHYHISVCQSLEPENISILESSILQYFLSPYLFYFNIEYLFKVVGNVFLIVIKIHIYLKQKFQEEPCITMDTAW